MSVVLFVVGVGVGRARANSSARARAGGGLEGLKPVLLLLLGLYLLFPLGFLNPFAATTFLGGTWWW
jgi:hypothetical protein